MFEWPCLIVLGSSAHVQQVPVHAGDPEPGESTIHPPNTRSPNSPNCPSWCADRLFQGPMKNVSEIKFQRFQPTSEVACERTSQHCSWNLSWAEMFQLRHEAEVNLHQITSRHINMNNSTDVRLIQLSPHLWKSTLRRPAASAWYQGRSSSPKAKRQSDTFRYRVESFIRKLYKSWFFFCDVYASGLKLSQKLLLPTCLQLSNFQPFSAPQEWHQADDRNLQQEPWMHIGTRWNSFKGDRWPLLTHFGASQASQGGQTLQEFSFQHEALHAEDMMRVDTFHPTHRVSVLAKGN